MWDKDQIPITSQMLRWISEVDQFKGAWKLFGKMPLDVLTKLKSVATIESIGSSTRIEGAKLSDQEIEALLLNTKSYSFISRDQQEVAGYAYACQQIFDHYLFMDLGESVIKQIHQWLLKYSAKDERHRGEYKKISNNIEAFDAKGKRLGVILETTSPFETPMQMQKLLAWTQAMIMDKSLHPLIVIGIFTVSFLAIHPFQDGNGRLSRLITTFLLLKTEFAYVPYSSLESVIEKSKDSYYLALLKTQKTLKKKKPDFDPWLTFFLQALVKQKIHLESKIKQEQKRLDFLSDLDHHILQCLASKGILSITQIQDFTKANRNTLKKHLSKLVSEQCIVKIGKGKNTVYSLFN